MDIMAIQNQYETKFQYDIEAKKELKNSVFLTESWIVPSILGLYVTFILVDKYILKNRKPMDLKELMMAYNVYQIIYNSYMFYLCILPEFLHYYMHHSCHPMDTSKNPLWPQGLKLAFMFFLSKLTDLMDTLFIVLRKKHNQISFLHLYHHIGMVTLSWIFLKYFIAEQLLIVILINSFVHMVMYTYYTLSLLGPSIQKYLWWKKYVTLLQMGQFLLLGAHMAFLVLNDCSQPKGVSFFVIVQTTVFFKLFKDFYNTKYQRCTPVNQEVLSSKEK